MTQTRPITGRGMPGWLAAILIILILLGAAWFVWTMWVKGLGDDRKGNVVVVDTGDQNGPFKRNDGSMIVRHESGGRLYVEKRREGGYRASLYFPPSLAEKWLTPEQAELSRLAEHIADRSSVARYVGLTVEQRRALNALAPRTQLAPGEEKQLLDLLLAWDQAKPLDKIKAGAKVREALAKVSASKLNDYKAIWMKRVTEIPRILSADQLVKAREYDRVQRVAASTQPAVSATRPAIAPTTRPVAAPSTRPAAAPTTRPAATVTRAPAATTRPSAAPATRPATQPAK